MGITRRIVQRSVWLSAIGAMILAGVAQGQDQPLPAIPLVVSPLPEGATMKQVMLDLIHPASNDIQFAISRAPKDDKEWAAVRRSALLLATSGPLLLERGPAKAPDWQKDVSLLVTTGVAAFKATQSKDSAALAQVGPALDAACTACHKQFRPNVFPKEGASK